jgi:hypothetical protein
MKNNFQKLLVALPLIFLTAFSCCTKKEITRWDDPLSFYSEDISEYFNASLGTEIKQKMGKQSVFVDFSDGLVQAYSSDTNNKVIDYISQKMVGTSIDWWGLGKNHSGVGKLIFENDREIYNKVISKSSYSDIMAPIEEALKMISSSSNDALLITDFEEYTPDGKEQKYAYAKDYFTKWVESGNSITFFYSSYTETNSRSRITGIKNLYFVIFNYGEIDENSLVSKFQKAIEGRNLVGLNRFEINPKSYSIKNDYGGLNKTGLSLDIDYESKTALDIGDKEGALVFFKNGFLNGNKPFEAFEFGQNLDELFENYFRGNRKFAKKLFLDASSNDSYLLKSVKLEVTDITNDYINYVRATEASHNKPTLIKDEGNNDIWNEESQINDIIKECYDNNTTNLKNECIYKYSHGLKISEVFDFDANIFNDRLKNSPNEIELITTFHNNYKGKFNNKEPLIIRIDYIIDKTDENYSSQLEVFKWNSIINASNGVNESLYESIRNTLQTVKPKGILYSYFLKIDSRK